MKERIILDLCGGTGSWSEPYKRRGYDVRLVTLPMYDVRNYDLPGEVHGVLAAPTCTIWANSGAQYWEKRTRSEILEHTSILTACLMLIARAKPVWWVIENPVGKMRVLLGEPTLIFQPFEFGDAYSKKTLLWGEFALPKKNPVEPIVIRDAVRGRGYSPVHWGTGGKSERTKMLRSMTPKGFAEAFCVANP